jgi:hypothetical protein
MPIIKPEVTKHQNCRMPSMQILPFSTAAFLRNAEAPCKSDALGKVNPRQPDWREVYGGGIVKGKIRRYLMMKAVELIGRVDDQHRLQVQVPESLPPGPVRLIVLIPEGDEAGAAWLQGIAREWAAELSDPREDIYTLEDGKPLDAAG